MKHRDDERQSGTDDIAAFLAEYRLEQPSQREIDETVELVLMHMPRRANVFEKAIGTFRKLLRTAAFEAHYVHPAYWAVLVLLYVGGIVAVGTRQANPFVTAMFLAPTPFVFGLFILFRNHEQGVAELEAACRYSLPQVMLAKYLLVSAVNVFADLVLISCISTVTGAGVFTKLLFLCLWPSFLLSAISFVVSANTRSVYVIAGTMGLWTALAAFSAQNPEFMTTIESVSIDICVPAACLWVLTFTWQLLRMKRGFTHEFVH